MENILVKEILDGGEGFKNKEVSISGWVRTLRSSKNVAFIEINDGSCFTNLQVVFEDSLPNFSEIEKATIGSSLRIKGQMVASPGSEQSLELKASEIILLGLAAEDNPIQKKRHSFEFLRTIPHFRSRTNTYMAVFRVRSILAQAIHRFFEMKKYTYVHTPIITGSDCEGAGELFHVSTLDLLNLPKTIDGKIDFNEELLGKEAFLTVSGQLAVEAFCFAFRNVYTFGPTFRAENSNTARHANEFWMSEAEIAFATLEDDMALAEEMIKFLINDLLEKAPEEMDFFNKFIDEGLIDRLNLVKNSEFAHVTYTEAIEILLKSGVDFEYPVNWNDGLQSEHERYLAETYFKKPVFVTDYPAQIKAFYMYRNDDGKTVRAMDLLVPGIGEIIGGSQREDRVDVLTEQLLAHGLRPEDYQWYLDIRRFGSFPHAGFGLGFERALMYFTGMKNIRDVIPYPRTPNNIMF
ncbi:MAG: asparagine--tRNA ligase [Candidatus Gracilibacteria bacterium]|nr:asparagine--tRNA ligase [Candidatus Gracilibacteria bacterium]